MLMTKLKVGIAVAALISAVALMDGVARAGVAGVVETISTGSITVSGATHSIERTTSLEDLSGARVDLREVRPGTPVELEFDEEGHLVTIRATVVR